MNINDAIMEKIISQIDISQYKAQIDKAAADFFASEYFRDTFHEALCEEGVSGELAAVIAKKLLTEAKKKITVSIG